MAWMPTDNDNDVHNPRIQILARKLGCSHAAAVGHWTAFRLWMLHHEISGDVNAQPSELLETGALWNGDPGVFLQALRDAHLVDLLGLVIDWDKRLERYTLFLLKEEKQNEKRRSAATQRKRDERKRDAEKAQDATIAILRRRTLEPLEPNKLEPNKIEPNNRWNRIRTNRTRSNRVRRNRTQTEPNTLEP